MNLRVRIVLGLSLASLFVAVACSSSPDHCVTNADCGAKRFCAYRIGDCAARGECFDAPESTCLALRPLCACNGAEVQSGCGFPDGYASGPTTGATPRADESCYESALEAGTLDAQ